MTTARVTSTDRLTLTLRALMELGIVVALAWWGYRAGHSQGTKILIATTAPLVGFGFWGAVDFHQVGRMAEPLRLIEELAISGLAAIAWYAAGQHVLGLVLGFLSLAYHTLVYARAGRLLKA
jgi:hypothetical protein